MAMNLEAVLRIAAKVVGVEEISKLEKSIASAEKAAGNASAAFRAVANSAIWQAAAAGAAVFTAGMGLATKAAIDFEASMADVRKVVNGLETTEAFTDISNEILQLSNQMPIAAKGFAEIYAAAGQSGIARDQLKEFATLVAQVSVAFDMTAQEAGTALAQMKVALGLTTPELRDLGDAMNYVSNNTGATAANLVEFMSRSGAVGKIAGLNATETMAFGAAMIQAGIQTEVASTSFNNMIKALSKGPSMTDRQVDALRRLGYSMVTAADEERRLTRVVEAESRNRIDKYRDETDQLLKEISRRYRNQLQQLQDGWDDETRALEDSLRDRADAQIRAINADESINEEAKRRAIDSIQDRVDEELRVIQRAARDRQQAARDQLDDQQEIERKAADRKMKAFEESERQFVESAKASAKKTGEELAKASTQGFADRMQTDAIGTITEVLGKIRDLPKSQQISILSDLFGDESRGLAPMIANLDELTRVIGLASDETGRAGSVANEYGVRVATAAAQIQLFWNQLQNTAIVIGTTVLPYVAKLTEALKPLVAGLAEFAKSNPGITAVAVAIGGIASAVVLAAPFILSFVALLGQLAPIAAGIGVTWAGLQTVMIVAVSGITAALGGLLSWMWTVFLPGALAFFSGPVGWTVLAIAAVVAMAIAFREPLMNFLAWLWEWGEPIRQFWIGLWDGLVAFVGFSLSTITKVLTTYVSVLTKLWSGMFSIMEKAAEVWQGAIEAVWTVVGEAFNTYLVEPIRTAWTAVTDWLEETIQSVVTMAEGAWTAMADSLRNVFRGVLQYIADQINTVAGLINQLIAGYNNLPNLGDIPLIPIINVPAFAEGGFVNRPTVGLVGEAGREYIIPESKMAAASSRFLAGQRGASVIPSGSSGGANSARSPQVNITTGPVMQQQDGTRWVSIDDLERSAQQTAEQVLAMLRTPEARIALGR